MCGIAGYVGEGLPSGEGAIPLRAMCDAIRQRGPDDAGYFTAPGVALGMRRLSIIDVAGGAQPIGNEDGTVQVVFNGEIYNYRELRTQLLSSGHRFASDTDTEVLVHLYEEKGEDLVHSLRGMFAFALWDAERRKLLVARDRLGIKPLYYWPSGAGMAFASELKSLLALPGFPRRIDLRALAEYLALGYVPDPDCIFAGVQKLEPGHLLSWRRERGAETSCYWSPAVAEDPTISEADAIAEIRRLLTESVRYRLIADVPLGAFLSGGIDSSAVVAEMARQMDRPVRTFSIGFEEPRFNEAPHAARVAKALGTDHTELVVRPDVDRLVERVVGAFDEPFADSSAIPMYLVSALAREHVTVALSGDGGDELFGGYARYSAVARRNLPLPKPLRRLLAAAARRLPQTAYGRNRLLELSRGPRGRYTGSVARALSVVDGGIATSAVARAGGELDEMLSDWFARVSERDFATQMMLVDTMTYLPGDILTKVDRMSMAVSLEARVPLLDHHLVEFAAALPSGLKMRNGEGKWILRQAIRDLVPEAVLTRPKQGFAVPLAEWFRGELRHRIDELLKPDAPVFEYVDRTAVRGLVEEHANERRNRTALLWRLVVLDLWLHELWGVSAREKAEVAALGATGS
ncbi:amidotransferase 1, exosortase A system-associated [soil metagenome]